METVTTLLISALMSVILVRLLLLPVKAVWKIAVYSGSGFLCLWLLNTAVPFTGIHFPVNAVTVLTAGILGIPGIGLLAMLAVL